MATKENARVVAVRALRDVSENEGYSNIVIDKALKSAELSKLDAALCTTIFYGVLEKKITLDFYLAHCYEKGKKLDGLTELILEAAAYQILFLDKIPESASVNEAVESSKVLGNPKASGFINAVLRKLLRVKGEITLPEGKNDKSLSLKYSVPQELIAMWKKAYGEENTMKCLEAFAQRPKTHIRVNNTQIEMEELVLAAKNEGAEVLPLDYPNYSAEIKAQGSPADLDIFKQGAFHVQDLSSQILCDIIAPSENVLVHDVCAAPGGKSFTLAEIMKGTGEVRAFDLYKGRVRLIKQGADRLKLMNISAELHDATKPHKSAQKADIVLCDVPCSGYGVIRRKPEIRYKKLETVTKLPELQYQILRNSLDIAKQNGIIIYSTCTLNPKENNDVAARFLQENKNVEAINLELHSSLKREIDEPPNMYTMFPFSGASDGFFVAAFRKTE